MRQGYNTTAAWRRLKIQNGQEQNKWSWIVIFWLRLLWQESKWTWTIIKVAASIEIIPIIGGSITSFFTNAIDQRLITSGIGINNVQKRSNNKVAFDTFSMFQRTSSGPWQLRKSWTVNGFLSLIKLLQKEKSNSILKHN